MANIYGENYTKEFINFPKEHGRGFEFNGKVRVIFDSVAAGAGADVLVLGRIPKNARILECSSVGGDSPSFNVAPADILSVDTQVEVTLGAGPVFPVSAWVTFVQD